jgi:hypothetical protein
MAFARVRVGVSAGCGDRVGIAEAGLVDIGAAPGRRQARGSARIVLSAMM